MTRRKSPPPALDWKRVERIRRASFHGTHPSDADLDYCTAAYEADPEHYGKIGEHIRKEYLKSLRWGR